MKAEERAITLCVLACGTSGVALRLLTFTMLTKRTTGILRNVAPFSPPSAVAALDLDKDVVLPVLVPVVSAVSLSDASHAVEVLVQQQVCTLFSHA